MFKGFLRDIDCYSTNQQSCRYKMDANENFVSVLDKDKIIDIVSKFDLNRYPEGSSSKLRQMISTMEGLAMDNIIMGSGSSEVIELLFKAIIGESDIVLGFSPSFSMYELYTNVQGGVYKTVDLEEDKSMNLNKLQEACDLFKPKLTIICNPNNPTASWVSKEDLILFIESNREMAILIDEAYVEFLGISIADKVNDFKNLFVAKTFSKAYGLAGLRLGYIASNSKNIIELNKIRPPYNINIFTQICGEIILDSMDKVRKNIELIKLERDKLYLGMLDENIKAFPSRSNFIYFYSDIEKLQEKLIDRGLLIRKYGGENQNYYRVTVGSQEENKSFLDNISEVIKIEKG